MLLEVSRKDYLHQTNTEIDRNIPVTELEKYINTSIGYTLKNVTDQQNKQHILSLSMIS